MLTAVAIVLLVYYFGSIWVDELLHHEHVKCVSIWSNLINRKDELVNNPVYYILELEETSRCDNFDIWTWKRNNNSLSTNLSGYRNNVRSRMAKYSSVALADSLFDTATVNETTRHIATIAYVHYNEYIHKKLLRCLPVHAHITYVLERYSRLCWLGAILYAAGQICYPIWIRSNIRCDNSPDEEKQESFAKNE